MCDVQGGDQRAMSEEVGHFATSLDHDFANSSNPEEGVALGKAPRERERELALYHVSKGEETWLVFNKGGIICFGCFRNVLPRCRPIPIPSLLPSV